MASPTSPTSTPHSTFNKLKKGRQKSKPKLLKRKRNIAPDEFRVRNIIDEDETRYLIDWEDSEDGVAYDPSWEPRENANLIAIADWEEVKLRRERAESKARRDRVAAREAKETREREIADSQQDTQADTQFDTLPLSSQGAPVAEESQSVKGVRKRRRQRLHSTDSETNSRRGDLVYGFIGVILPTVQNLDRHLYQHIDEAAGKIDKSHAPEEREIEGSAAVNGDDDEEGLFVSEYEAPELLEGFDRSFASSQAAIPEFEADQDLELEDDTTQSQDDSYLQLTAPYGDSVDDFEGSLENQQSSSPIVREDAQPQFDQLKGSPPKLPAASQPVLQQRRHSRHPREAIIPDSQDIASNLEISTQDPDSESRNSKAWPSEKLSLVSSVSRKISIFNFQQRPTPFLDPTESSSPLHPREVGDEDSQVPHQTQLVFQTQVPLSQEIVFPSIEPADRLPSAVQSAMEAPPMSLKERLKKIREDAERAASEGAMSSPLRDRLDHGRSNKESSVVPSSPSPGTDERPQRPIESSDLDVRVASATQSPPVISIEGVQLESQPLTGSHDDVNMPEPDSDSIPMLILEEEIDDESDDDDYDDGESDVPVLQPQLGTAEYLVLLPLTAFIRSLYDKTIKHSKHPITSVVNGRGTPEDELAISSMMRDLYRLCTHQDLICNLTESQLALANTQDTARWAQNCSTKCLFLTQLLERLRSVDLHIVIFADAGYLMDILESLLVTENHSYSRPDKKIESTQDLLKITLLPTSGEQFVIGRVDAVIAFDYTYVEAHKQNSIYLDSMRRSPGSNELKPLITLIITQSIEHIQLCLRQRSSIELPSSSSTSTTADLDLLAYTALTRKTAGILDNKAFDGPLESALSVASFLSGESSVLPPSQSHNITGLQLPAWSQSTQTTSLTYPSNSLESSSKRPLDISELPSDTYQNKKAKMSREGRFAAMDEQSAIPAPLFSSLQPSASQFARQSQLAHQSQFAQQAHPTQQSQFAPQSSRPTGPQFSQQSPFSQDQLIIRDLQHKLHEVSVENASALGALEAAAFEFQNLHAANQNLHQTYGADVARLTIKQQEFAILRQQLAAACQEVEVANLKNAAIIKERDEIRDTFTTFRQLDSPSVSQVALKVAADHDVHDFALEIQKLEKKLASAKKDQNFFRQQYQEMSTLALERGNELVQLKADLSAAETRAENVREHVLHGNENTTIDQLVKHIDGLKNRLDFVEDQLRYTSEELARKNEELKARGSVRQTRGTSLAPGSSTGSPRGPRSMGSRGVSPAASSIGGGAPVGNMGHDVLLPPPPPPGTFNTFGGTSATQVYGPGTPSRALVHQASNNGLSPASRVPIHHGSIGSFTPANRNAAIANSRNWIAQNGRGPRSQSSIGNISPDRALSTYASTNSLASQWAPSQSSNARASPHGAIGDRRQS